VAKTKKKGALSTDLGEALAKQETPSFKWKAVLQVAGAFAVLWLTAFMVVPYVGYWAVGVVGVLTLVAAGFGIYIWRLTSRSRAVVEIMKQATDAAGREKALEDLASGADGDAMKALARAQLLSQTQPNEALKVLEAIDVEKAPAVLRDDVRAQLAMLYLRNNRARDARDLTDAIRLDKRPDAKSKGLYAAIMAEALARTGSAEEARKLLETYSPESADGDEVRAMLLRAQVYTFTVQKKRGRVGQALAQLAALEPNLLGGFLTKGNPPELVKMTQQALAGAGMAPKVKMKRMR